MTTNLVAASNGFGQEESTPTTCHCVNMDTVSAALGRNLWGMGKPFIIYMKEHNESEPNTDEPSCKRTKTAHASTVNTFSVPMEGGMASATQQNTNSIDDIRYW